MLGRTLTKGLRRSFGTRDAPLKTQLFIDGQWVNSAKGDTFETMDPYSEKPLVSLQRASSVDVDKAVLAARIAFDHGPWRKMAATERGNLLLKLADLVDQNAYELGCTEAMDNGKPASVAWAADLPLTAATYRYYGGWADKILGDTIPAPGNVHAYTRREPVGVAAQIIPWNFPLLMQAWKLGPALAAGCTVVMKTAEQTPLTGLMMGELIQKAGFPDGVVNIISGYGEDAGAHLATHPDIDKVAFTGSTEVGLKIMQNSSLTGLKRVTLELGGKSPNIICEDADVDMAVQQAQLGLFFNQGQCCIAGSRVFVHEKIYDEFAEKAARCSQTAVLGDPQDPKTTQGPQVSKQQQETVWNFIQKGKKEGATVLAGGEKYEGKGYFVNPTVFGDVTDDMAIARDEIFGPVMQIMKFSDYDEVIERANRSQYGLGAGIVTKDMGRALHLVNSLRAGTVYVNCYDVFAPNLPFGGYKNSGIGRENGPQGMDNYLETKTVIMARPDGSLP